MVVDAGGLIAYERGNQAVAHLIRRSDRLHISTGVLAQVWRGGGGVARIAQLIRRPAVNLHPIDTETAKVVGVMCGDLDHADIVDVHVVLLAVRYQSAIMTSDPDDMASLGIPSDAIIAV